jgi:hypothetical protein
MPTIAQVVASHINSGKNPDILPMEITVPNGTIAYVPAHWKPNKDNPYIGVYEAEFTATEHLQGLISASIISPHFSMKLNLTHQINMSPGDSVVLKFTIDGG